MYVEKYDTDLEAMNAAIKEAILDAREKGVKTTLFICQDTPGKHQGGPSCFCKPRAIRISPEGIEKYE